jgi:hypothetical protein
MFLYNVIYIYNDTKKQKIQTEGDKMTLQEKQNVLSRIFNTRSNISGYTKERAEGIIEGIIIGASINISEERKRLKLEGVKSNG